MLKWLSLLALVTGLQAHANDGGIVTVDVLGIAPAAGVSTTEVKVYGEDTRKLAQVLPVTDVMGGRSVHLVSGQWAASIYCEKQYGRPSNGETRTDWMCTFSLQTRAESGVDDQDGEKAVGEAKDFTRFTGSPELRALGIVPGGNSGTVFNVYGERLNLLATKLPPTLTFNSDAYQVEFLCERSYRRPTTGEMRNDYFCSLQVLNR